MRVLLLFFYLGFACLYGASTVSKIANSKKDLSATDSAKKQASRKLEKIASDMKKAEKEIDRLENLLDRLGENKEKTEKAYTTFKEQLEKSNKALNQTSGEIAKKHKAFVTLLSNQFSVIFAMKQFDNPTKKSVISYEVYKAYKKHNTKDLKVLKSEIALLKKSKKNETYQRNKTKKAIESIVKKRERYQKDKLHLEKLIATLGDDEEKYQAKLQNIVDKQSSLRNTLATLNILRTQEVEVARKRAAERREAIRLEKERLRKIRKAKALAKVKARKAKQARLALRRAKTKKARKIAKLAAKKAEAAAKQARKTVYKRSAKVKKVNTSYKKVKTFSYRGGKTISPLPGARIVKRFGTYVDPIYKIKIFNESITLQAPSANARVKNVLNGKVVFAGKSSMLGKVVVVAHSGRMHTVYAGLSKIAPTIHVGAKIKQGYVVGKVARKLMFQATKNSKHINPTRLIRI